MAGLTLALFLSSSLRVCVDFSHTGELETVYIHIEDEEEYDKVLTEPRVMTPRRSLGAAERRGSSAFHGTINSADFLCTPDRQSIFP